MTNKVKKLAKNITLPLIVIILNFLIMIFPKETLSAAKEALGLWLNNVMPALLPFAVGVNILSALGIVGFAGVLLEPVMSPLFHVPGGGGFALVTGLLSGYPLGARVTAELRLKEVLSDCEAQRLVSFSNNSGPLFIIGVVGAGMFGSVMAGYFIYAAHFLGAIATGLLFRFYKHKKERKTPKTNKRLLFLAYRSMSDHRRKTQKGFGAIMSESVMGAMETLLLVGGFIILFGVIISALDMIGLFMVLEEAAQSSGLLPVMPEGFWKGIFIGAVEITNGTKALSDLFASESTAVFIAAAGIISWGGLSIHAQAISLISKTEINAALYLLAKLIHAALACVFADVLYPVYNYFESKTVTASTTFTPAGFLNNLLQSIVCLFAALVIITITSAAVTSVKAFRNRL